MADASITGQVHLIEPTKSFGQKGFRKRLVVLEQVRGKFTNFVPLDFIGDACDSVDDLKLGDTVRVTYRLSGRKWQRDPDSEVKFFLSAEAVGFEFADKPGVRKSGSPKAAPAGDEDFEDFGPDDGSAPF